MHSLLIKLKVNLKIKKLKFLLLLWVQINLIIILKVALIAFRNMHFFPFNHYLKQQIFSYFL